MSHRSDRRRYHWNLGLLLAFVASGLSSCTGSAPTLSLQNAASEDVADGRPPRLDEATSTPKTPHSKASVVIKPPQVAAVPASDPEWTPLLTKVDRAQLLGSWQDSFFGSRTLTLNADGSARMQLDFDLAGSLRYGQRVDFEMKWWLEGAVVKVDMITGKPADAAKAVMDDWGTHHIYLLDRVEPELIEMRDPEHTLKHSLRRVR